MRVWRLTRAPFAATPFDGLGPARAGARWNSRGVHVAYAASSRALALLEILVHVTRENAPADFVFIEADVPDAAIETLDAARLPDGWRIEPPPAALRAIGDDWVREHRSLALRVPSAVVPEESNVLVNPAHDAFAALRIVGPPRPVVLDPRLLERNATPLAAHERAERYAENSGATAWPSGAIMTTSDRLLRRMIGRQPGWRFGACATPSPT